MFPRAFILSVVLLLSPLGFSAEENRENPMVHMSANAAVDGILIVSNSAEFPFTLRIVGGEPQKTSAADGQLWIGAKDSMFQNTIVPVSSVLPKNAKQGDDKVVLTAHAAWECKHHNELTKQSLAAKPEFIRVSGRTWSHWTYDLSEFIKRMKEQKPEEIGGVGPKSQHLMTTVIGKHIIVLICTTMNGQNDGDTKDALVKAAGTCVVYPKPLSQEQIEKVCTQKQP